MIKIKKIQKQQLTSDFIESRQLTNVEYVGSIEDLLNHSSQSNSTPNDATYQAYNGNDLIGILYIYNISRACVYFSFYKTESNLISTANIVYQISDFIFDNYDSLKISCEIIAGNNNFLELHMKNGFEQEAYFKNSIFFQSELKDVVHLSCHRGNFNKYLKLYLSKVYAGDKFSINIGDEYTEEVVFNNESIKNYAQLTADKNPIHLSEICAQEAGFKKNIVHGMLSASIFSKILATDFPGVGSIYLSQDLKFIKPIYPNDILIVYLKVLSIIGSKIIISTKIESNGSCVILGTAKVINADKVKK